MKTLFPSVTDRSSKTQLLEQVRNVLFVHFLPADVVTCWYICCWLFIIFFKCDVHCLHVRLAERDLHYIQPPFSLCPDVYRIWDEPPKVSFLTAIRGLAPFFLTSSFVSCAACVVTTNAWTYNRVLFHPRKHPVTVTPVFPPSCFLFHCLCLFLSISFLCFLPVIFFFFTSFTFFSFFSLCSIQTRDTQALSRWLPYTTPTPQAPPAPVWPGLTLTAPRPVP